jgi:hypothetical protein
VFRDRLCMVKDFLKQRKDGNNTLYNQQVRRGSTGGLRVLVYGGSDGSVGVLESYESSPTRRAH